MAQSPWVTQTEQLQESGVEGIRSAEVPALSNLAGHWRVAQLSPPVGLEASKEATCCERPTWAL